MNRPRGSGRHVTLLAITLACAWILWSWHFEALLLVFGALSCLVVVLLCWRMGIIDDEGEPLLRLKLRPLFYIPWLLWQIVRSNVDVARRILSPSVPISPKLIEVPSNQKTDLGNVIYANSITLTPGTITIRIRDGVILVHALSEEAAEELLEGEMGRRVRACEGEA
ncbi:MAG: Na+/H+ antiporter subunit E [Planctomycetota bacterium]|nr:Na+/H+ antiporter subunit E [Planctomycetota bacterium]